MVDWLVDDTMGGLHINLNIIQVWSSNWLSSLGRVFKELIK